METALVSIIMPMYNAGKFLSKSIESVLEQTYQNWELLLIDDGSKDDSIDIALAFMEKDSRIFLLKNEQNMGIAKTRNKGIEASKGQYIAFLDSDDIWLPDKLKIQLTFMQQHQVDFSYCSYEVVDDHGTKIGERKISETKLDYHEMLKGNRIGLLTVMLSRKIAQKYPFPEINHEDYACWLSIARNGTVAYLASEQILAKYRKHQTSLSANKIQAAQWTWTIYRRHEHLGLFKSFYYFLHYSLMGLTDKR